MRFRTLEIRWHDSKPISSCDFQPVPFKKARPPPGSAPSAFAAQAYRLATAGEDNHVRVWMVYPNIRPLDLEGGGGGEGVAPRPARVEYLATLSRHSAAVNVVRFSPNGDLIASAGDDGMVIIWAPSATPQTSTYGSDLSPDDLQHEKEYWKPRTTFRCTTMQVYDLAWSPTGEFLLAGSTDNCARVFASVDGKCLHEIAEHAHYVQGVAWDPLGEYIATQSSDRSMHVYRGTFEAHAIGRNTRFPHSHRDSHSSQSHQPHSHRDSFSHQNTHGSGTGSGRDGGRDRAHSRTPSVHREELLTPSSLHLNLSGRDVPAAACGPSSRRSSFSGSNAPSSPSGFSAVSGFSRAYGRSPSPMPALPAIRTPPSASAGWAGRYEERTRSRDRYDERSRSNSNATSRYADERSGTGRYADERGRYGYDERRHTDGARLYGDESFSNFFRRLAFSPDGALLLTPAGTFEDPSASVVARPVISTGAALVSTSLGMGSSSSTTAAQTAAGDANPNSSVYIYSRANFARPPVAQLPGHKKASVAVRFSPVLFELRPNVQGGGGAAHASQALEPRMGTGTATGEEGEQPRDVEESMEVDLVGPVVPSPPANTNANAGAGGGIAAPAPQRSFDVLASPALSPTDLSAGRRPPTPAASKPGTPAPVYAGTPASLSVTPNTSTGSVFALPYRMLYAVVTMDTVAIYDTQQAGPVPDGQCLMLSSRDGYCTLVTFDEILPTHHTQQAALQLQQIAAVHSVPISYAPSSSQSQSGSQSASGSQSGGRKRPLEPLTPAASVDGDREQPMPMPTSTPTPASAASGMMSASTSGASISSLDTDAEAAGEDGPPKKKRRVALTRVGDL
ncbi:WD40-repeat-containing domain protein [Mycena leptocephala]|nr:WD40-repeat-containing domain protein [Mycena leptocephala]